MSAAAVSTSVPAVVDASIEKWRVLLETGLASGTEVAPEGLFAPDVFGDLTFPHWRLQTSGIDALLEVRRTGHPQPGVIRVEKVTGDASGYVMKIEERWHDGGQDWYCREAFLCDLDESGRVTEFSLYCTGDWDEQRQSEHAEAVDLLRP